MSNYPQTFIEDCLRGRAKAADIDSYVEGWHTREENGADLASYLGMSEDEYEKWLRDPDALPGIIAAHRRNMHAAE